ncbi:phosphoribosylformylglycinamidine synthase [Marivirga atlantica]|jgi:phosphoribosylformylglycinamidine synthase|uniref:Phosphoribosylformylglycinamidine synthase n=1 Tax=Marivirga atlantica TaxID=1548457 RepID=A0A937ABD0_9BACT|nr:phosphoribosylformylglycinamidine synthase [Marivirga atlantica]MBL0765720.1 phosphoribosylformylglycinamidine synthase [Marivirga atlantica]
MLTFFIGKSQQLFAVDHQNNFDKEALEKLKWLFDTDQLAQESDLKGNFVGPRKELVTPWSTNAVEITQTMGINKINRIEEFFPEEQVAASFDPMLQAKYVGLNEEIFQVNKVPDKVLEIDDISTYNEQEGLALSNEEIEYLKGVSEQLGRKLTDSEVFGFSQVNSEHCRHKIFNGTFVVDGKEMPSTLFQLIKKTSKENPNRIISAYKDNVAYLDGPSIEQFAPEQQDKASYFTKRKINSTISLKAETHNFPTTVEPFYGAATGSGGEIRDRMAGGKAGIPLAGTAVYMTSYSRLKNDRNWEQQIKERPWLYQTPMDILIKASNGASDFGNKFGQPLIAGSVLTFEHNYKDKKYGYDKVIMQAGGIGYGVKEEAQKDTPEKGDKIVVMGGDNYRIGMGGSAVSSVDTGELSNELELNAVQRANPEMQKRVANVIRAMAELGNNPIVSIHDHGAGGHLNCLSELVEDTGGKIDLQKLPVGDSTLSAKEIIGNESQERMGLVIKEKDVPLLKKMSKRERAPFYVVGEITGDHHFSFVNAPEKKNPVDWPLTAMFGNSPKTILEDKKQNTQFSDIIYEASEIEAYVKDILKLEAVACKDWLTNKVDRCVTGKVAKQQTTGEIQLPLNNVAVMALDFNGKKGIATSIGHAPVSALIKPKSGSQLSIAEALTNLVWAPIEQGLKGVSLSANWMWPAKNEGENSRLYDAVEAVSDFAIELGINIPTGKDSLSMVQKYPDGEKVFAPGTVIISAAGEAKDIRKVLEPTLKPEMASQLIYINMAKDSFELGGSSFAQTRNQLGNTAPEIKDVKHFAKAFETVQQLIEEGKILAGHDIGSGGLITSLLEMCFPTKELGLNIDLSGLDEKDIVKVLFSEQPALLLQVADNSVIETLKAHDIEHHIIGHINEEGAVNISNSNLSFDVSSYRDLWFETSYLLDQKQSGEKLAKERFDNYKAQSLNYRFPDHFNGTFESLGLDPKRNTPSGVKAAIIREKGVNSDREMAYMMHMVGFDVKDIHMTDLMSGEEDLTDVNFIVFTGGFSNSDVLGSAKGWAGAFKYNENAKNALDNFYAREDTLSMGVCNGCQLMVALDLLYPDKPSAIKMEHNDSHKFECGFVNLEIPENNSIMLNSLSKSRLGIWLAHGEGKFSIQGKERDFNIVARYGYEQYPANPNGSDFNAAAICTKDGRHLAIMPHLERSIFPWNWAHYPAERKADEFSPWVEALVNAFNWVKLNKPL